jgi:hypothetical protein
MIARFLKYLPDEFIHAVQVVGVVLRVEGSVDRSTLVKNSSVAGHSYFSRDIRNAGFLEETSTVFQNLIL